MVLLNIYWTTFPRVTSIFRSETIHTHTQSLLYLVLPLLYTCEWGETWQLLRHGNSLFIVILKKLWFTDGLMHILHFFLPLHLDRLKALQTKLTEELVNKRTSGGNEDHMRSCIFTLVPYFHLPFNICLLTIVV